MTARRWAAVAVALVGLNVSLSYANVWPTLGIKLTTAVSLELAVVVAALVVWRGRVSSLGLGLLAAAWVALVIGRYIDVTTRSLFGRDLNLYWDLRHVPNVGAMFATVADRWLAWAFVAAVVLVPFGLFLAAWWALNQVRSATGSWGGRLGLGGLAGVVLAVMAAQWVGWPLGPLRLTVAEPVTPVYVRELGELVYEMTGAGVSTLGPPPRIESDFTRLGGADVVLIFLESYGAVSWDHPEFAEGLAPSRARLEGAIEETGRSVRSAFVEATTFGGESWLSHITLLSGTEVRDQGTNVRLMAQSRDTLVKAFGRHGYRTIAIMPGLQVAWPEGGFYGFDKIYDLAELDYHGPPFGWWSITDQFALARMDQLEIAPVQRKPAFVVFPTITTHAPFSPAPPYQPDWDRILSPDPFDPEVLDEAWSDYPDWTNLGPSYVKALSYANQTLAGYLRLRADRDLVLIVVGDHQPPALVTGEGAGWEVPIHIVTDRADVLERLERHGFSRGLTPRHPQIARMDGLLPILLDAFGDVPREILAE